MTAISTFYRTPAIDRAEQPDYRNGVVLIETDSPPRDLKFGILRSIECELGRERSSDKFAARTIDLDIAVYGDLVIEEPDLMVPDPGIMGRLFVAVPLLELAPKLIIPGTGRKLADLIDRNDSGELEADIELTEELRKRFCL